MEKMFTLKGSRLPAADVKNIIFFVRPRLELMDIIAENVLRYSHSLCWLHKRLSLPVVVRCQAPSLQLHSPARALERGLRKLGQAGKDKRGDAKPQTVQTVGGWGHRVTPLFRTADRLDLYQYRDPN